MTLKRSIQRFLVVDDSRVERTYLRGLLKQHWPDCEVREVESAEAGLAAVHQEAPDLVLADYCMSHTTGLDLVTELHRTHPQVPVVVITGLGCEQTAVNALQAGAASYVSKSTSRHELISVLTSVLDLAQVQRNRRRVIGCLTGMDLQFEIGNDTSLASPLVRYLQEQTSSLRAFDESQLLRLGVALQESLSNAVNHGNLELDSELRQEDESIYYVLAETRCVQWPYCDRKVRVFASFRTDQIKFVIRDEGPGFNHVQTSDPTDEENLSRVGGRGLLLIRTFMDDVYHNERGNEITLVKHLEPVTTHSIPAPIHLSRQLVEAS